MAGTGWRTRAPGAGSNWAAAKGVICRADGDREWLLQKNGVSGLKAPGPRERAPLQTGGSRSHQREKPKETDGPIGLFVRRRYGSRQGRFNRHGKARNTVVLAVAAPRR